MISGQAKYSYTPYELRRCIRSEDFWKFSNTLKKENVGEVADNAATHFNSNEQILNAINSTSLKGNRVFTSSSIEETLCARRTDQILRRTLNITPANRDNEVKQLITILNTEPYGLILRTDIKSFFESVELAKVVEKLEEVGFRNPACLSYLKKLNEKLIKKYNYNGLPRGLPFSSTLGEFILKELDHSITTNKTVIFYSRFVDDIAVVYLDDNLDLKKRLDSNLPLNLELNQKKTESSSLKKTSKINYLGYCIGIGNNEYVKIADSKIGKAKKRIVLALRDFVNNKNFSLLHDRITFLSSNIIIEKADRNTPVCSGYKYDYQYCTPTHIKKQLNDLDSFLFGIIYSNRYWLGRKLRNILSNKQINNLKKLSFCAGYEYNITHKLDRNRVSDIKRVWKYE